MRYKPVVIGQVFGQLTVTGESLLDRYKFTLRCSCGSEFEATKGSVRSGNTASCGCRRKATLIRMLTTHGLSDHELIGVWRDMRRRCYDPKVKSYKYYGARGIKVSESWKEFPQFLRDMGERPFPDATIERKDVNADYSAENCIWIAKGKQVDNRTVSLVYEYDGVSYSLSGLATVAATFGVSRGALKGRLDNKWAVKRAVEHPTEKVGWHVKPTDSRDREGVKLLYPGE